MDKKDIKIKVGAGELNSLDPTTKQLVLDMKRHFNGIIYAIIRWSLANKQQAETTSSGARKTNPHQSNQNSLGTTEEV